MKTFGSDNFLRRKVLTTTIYLFLLWEASIILIFGFFYLVQIPRGAMRLDGTLKSIVDENKLNASLDNQLNLNISFPICNMGLEVPYVPNFQSCFKDKSRHYKYKIDKKFQNTTSLYHLLLIHLRKCLMTSETYFPLHHLKLISRKHVYI